MADEQSLRNKLKRVMGKDIEWVEPAWGSTVGLPDANLSFGKLKFPVELKYWKFTRFGLKSEMRPAQIRYHVMGAKKGRRSAIIFATDVVGSAGEFYMHMLPNTKCPRENYCLRIEDVKLVGLRLDQDESVRRRIEALLIDEEFWDEA